MSPKNDIFLTSVRPFLSADGKKSASKILGECKDYRRSFRMGHGDYFSLGLYMSYIDQDIIAYFPKGLVYRHLMAMNGELYPALARDKSLMAERLLAHRVPCPEEILSFAPGRGYADAGGKSCSVKQASELIVQAGGRAFAKPTAGKGGGGAQIVSADPESLQQIGSGNQAILFQHVLAQHPVLESLNPSSINTVRIHTLRTDDQVETHVASLRMGRKGQIVDNAANGGLCAGIDMATGRLDQFARTKPQFATSQFDRHPDTEVAFGSVTLPFWSEVIDLVCRGASAMAPLRSLGWDIAITPDGPVVVEVNSAWDATIFQLCKPLGTTGLAQHILAHAARDS